MMQQVHLFCKQTGTGKKKTNGLSLCGSADAKKDLGVKDEKRRKERESERQQRKRERKQQRWLGQKQYCIIEMTCELKALKVLPRARS